MQHQFISSTLKIVGVLTIVGLGFITVSAFIDNEVDAISTSKENKSFEEDYNVFALEAPENLNFAGERIPLEDPDIYERFDRELLVNTYWQSNALLLIKRANKYFPLIEPILKEEGVPDDFKYLAVAESGLTQVVSPAGATGFWQIMKTTAREYGLEVNDNVDERYHIELSTRVACEYLKKAKEKFGSWSLAAASYNRGMAGIQNQLERQETSNYYDLLLNEETRRYVFRIVALKTILSQPKAYGFHFEADDLYELKAYKIVEVDTAVTNFAAFARQFNLSYKTLKNYNPWLRDKNLNNSSRKLYRIKIPQMN
ncbi:lytic transglycosylase domain-containing protein [Psychroflexus sp. ALD_RP9]|uniref:lytic transglycosylase domain-containing protein n=1 Tax=Psychroflexus sp. ALD_RP9 TaxID=2777186 RepID=UPI001A90BB7E|nr:lytic transglycosylase domain-containing protein [Psychroflexus sp. ALD_RP9]QSS96556.1 lytic transglycosylase domain-containing protein [Psychroflexus sp. ALD_RP9]